MIPESKKLSFQTALNATFPALSHQKEEVSEKKKIYILLIGRYNFEGLKPLICFQCVFFQGPLSLSQRYNAEMIIGFKNCKS